MEPWENQAAVAALIDVLIRSGWLPGNRGSHRDVLNTRDVKNALTAFYVSLEDQRVLAVCDSCGQRTPPVAMDALGQVTCSACCQSVGMFPGEGLSCGV